MHNIIHQVLDKPQTGVFPNLYLEQWTRASNIIPLTVTAQTNQQIKVLILIKLRFSKLLIPTNYREVDSIIQLNNSLNRLYSKLHNSLNFLLSLIQKTFSSSKDKFLNKYLVQSNNHTNNHNSNMLPPCHLSLKSSNKPTLL